MDKIFNYCLYRTANRFVAEDITSDTFLKFFKSNWQRLESPVSYLYAICRNVITDHYRSYKPTVSLETLLEQGVEFGATDDSEKRLIIIEILKKVDTLPEEQKEVILMQYVQDLDNKTIGQIIGKTESAVKSLAHRVLETLRRELIR